jgi:hypothetical protein
MTKSRERRQGGAISLPSIIWKELPGGEIWEAMSKEARVVFLKLLLGRKGNKKTRKIENSRQPAKEPKAPQITAYNCGVRALLQKHRVTLGSFPCVSLSLSLFRASLWARYLQPSSSASTNRNILLASDNCHRYGVVIKRIHHHNGCSLPDR